MAEALRRIGELYAIEAKVRAKPSQERCRVRQAEARPLLESLEAWLRTTMETLSRKSDTTAAILYALNRWAALTRYCDDGAIEIDNSAAERALRGVALGRKNYLFTGADSGGERAAAMYSLIERPNLMASIRKRICGKCWHALPTIRSTGSRSCCRGE